MRPQITACTKNKDTGELTSVEVDLQIFYPWQSINLLRAQLAIAEEFLKHTEHADRYKTEVAKL